MAGYTQPRPDNILEIHAELFGWHRRRSIILGIQGYHDHWTVIEKITNRSILLYDSAMIKRLPRSFCTTSDATGSVSMSYSPPRPTSSQTKSLISPNTIYNLYSFPPPAVID
ncbi:MAG: hypothetical protein IPJ47_17410 [Anaerolineales bacterium]|nr:hypothetical protein [Anaerolineales bacterium]